MLKVLQQQFSVDILQNGNCTNYLSNGNFNGKDLIKIYRNNYYITLTSVLSSTYSCIKRLVGKDFFKFLSKQYIDENQPTSGNIINYGDSFANFIANCKQCDSLPYLSDVAKSSVTEVSAKPPIAESALCLKITFVPQQNIELLELFPSHMYS